MKQLQELKKQMDQLEALESLKRDGLDLTEHMQVLNEGGGELDYAGSVDSLLGLALKHSLPK